MSVASFVRPERRSGAGRVAGARAAHILLAALLALAAVLAPARAPSVAAVSDGLELTTAATYRVSPSDRVVHVAIDVTARNNKPNVTSGGILTRYFYDGARLAIHPEARNVAAREGGVLVKASTSAADGYDLLDVRFRASIFYHQTARIRITYDLPSGRPRSSSDIRVGVAFVTFVAWAFGDRASVRVDIPSSFDTESTGATVTKTTTGTTTTFRATGITDVGPWYLVVTADRPGRLALHRIDLAGGEHLVIRAWPEDTEWTKHVTDLLTKGLPELVEQTGLDWPVDGDIEVFEVHTPLLEGYAGVFFEGQDKIEISEDLDDLTIIHEASHAWFNSDLFVGRWIDEGLADTYAAWTLHGIGAGEWAPETISSIDPNGVRLNEWVHPGRITDDATEAREQFGYNAAWTVIRSIFTEIGSDRMRDVMDAAEARRIPYAGAGEPETMSGVADWKRLLDLFEEVGSSKTATEQFRRWVVTPGEATLLDQRATARTAYAALVAAGGDWLTPFYVREPMSAWRFDEATKRMAEATSVLARRDQIAKLAGALGLTPPAGLHEAYTHARDSLDAAAHLADAEIASLKSLTIATDAVAAPRAPFVTIGLIGETPEAALAAARDAFTAGAPDAEARAAAVTALIDGSVAIGRSRLTTATVVLVVVLILLVVLVVALRRRRGRRRQLVLAAEAASAASAEAMAADPLFGPAILAEQPAEPAMTEPAVTAPATAEPAMTEPATTQPRAKTPAARKPAARKTATKEPAAGQSAAKEPAARKPAAKKPAARKPATKKPASTGPTDARPDEVAAAPYATLADPPAEPVPPAPEDRGDAS
jgi:hypothetical protein